MGERKGMWRGRKGGCRLVGKRERGPLCWWQCDVDDVDVLVGDADVGDAVGLPVVVPVRLLRGSTLPLLLLLSLPLPLPPTLIARLLLLLLPLVADIAGRARTERGPRQSLPSELRTARAVPAPLPPLPNSCEPREDDEDEEEREESVKRGG